MLRNTSNWFRKFWASERGLSIFLTFLLVFVFLLPPIMPNSPFGGHLAGIFFLLLLVAGVAAVSRRRWQMVVMLTVVVAAAVVELADRLVPSTYTAIWADVASLAILGLFAVVVIAQVFRGGPVTSDRILGAVAAYLLFGLTWASAYHLVAAVVPEAFAGAVPKSCEPLSSWIYYSFVTLTTVGYGDITPVALTARSLAILEALTGQLYPAILLARLVSLELLSRPESAAAAAKPDGAAAKGPGA